MHGSDCAALRNCIIICWLRVSLGPWGPSPRSEDIVTVERQRAPDPGRVTDLFVTHFKVPAGEPDLGLLCALVESFSGIPYENITKIIRKFTSPGLRERLRGPEEVLTGYIDRHTGGTCFSLTYCLGAILTGAGYTCHPAMADMKRPNIHCALVVHTGGKRYLVDPGYLLGEPVELGVATVAVPTSFGTVELRPRSGERYDLFTISGGEAKWRYRVRTSPVPRSLFLKYWQESFSLPMMNSIQLTRLTDRGHLYVRDHHMRLRRGGEKLNENIRSELELRIEREFGIPADITSEAREHLERMKQSWRTQRQENRPRQSR
jgi:arylamine N-acetyltransferase